MKWLLVPLFIFIFGTIKAQDRYPNLFPDSSVSVGFFNFYQKEDIYTLAFLQMNISKKLMVDIGAGSSWRGGLSRGTSAAAQIGFHYNLSKYSLFFYGPSVRYFHELLRAFDKTTRFTRNGGEVGYHFSYGQKWKVIQSSYAGLHGFKYNTVDGVNSKLYFGYSFQLGLGYEF